MLIFSTALQKDITSIKTGIGCLYCQPGPYFIAAFGADTTATADQHLYAPIAGCTLVALF
jgi:hypothetical protein